VQRRLNRSRCRLRADSRGPKEPCVRWKSISHGKGTFELLRGYVPSVGIKLKELGGPLPLNIGDKIGVEYTN